MPPKPCPRRWRRLCRSRDLFAITIFLLIVATMASDVVAQAGPKSAPLSIENAGFEDPVMADNTPSTGTNNLIPGWSGTNTLDFSYGVWNPSVAYFPLEAPEGANVAYLERGSISQTLTDGLMKSLTYTLSVDVGRNAVTEPTFVTIELLAGTEVVAATTLAGISPGTFTRISITHRARPGDPGLGWPITVRFSTDDDPADGSEISLDNVTLTAQRGRGRR